MMNGGYGTQNVHQGSESTHVQEETVDAGLKSLDHCTFPKHRVPLYRFPDSVLSHRPTTTPAMALLRPTEAPPSRPVGDSLPRLHADQDAHTCT
jgi:hypothetical protein